MNTSIQGNTRAIQPQNDFKPFATNPDANVIGQAEYETLSALQNGFRKGLARSSELNKVMRQSASMTAALARFAASKTGEDIRDNGDIDTLARQIETAIGSVSSLHIAEAEGSANALAAHFSPAIRELKHGLPVHVRAQEKNTGTGTTFDADTTGAKPVVKGNNLTLEAGDIAGAGHWLDMQYDEGLDKWVLKNPAKGITPPSGVPVGTIEYFAMATPPAGYLKADGTAVGRETYPDLFAAIGTTFGVGDGETTFNLPDLIDRFAQGSNTPGQKLEAGLPNITGNNGYTTIDTAPISGAYTSSDETYSCLNNNGRTTTKSTRFDASRSDPIYGASDTVQPPALTLLPCIKAFDAVTNPGLIDISGLANEVASRKQVTETFNDGTNWYRKWSDGWVEQGGIVSNQKVETVTITLLIPMSDSNYYISRQIISDYTGQPVTARIWASVYNVTATQFTFDADIRYQTNRWYACGQAAQS